MALFELVVALLTGGALLTIWSGRVGIPYPVLLALAGGVAAYVPGVPAVAFDPALALALFVAPVLLDSAFDASPRDLRHSWLTIGLLAVVVVALTVAAVALAVHALVPGLSWPAAVAIGAIVAPPDAAAATAVLRTLRPPHRILVILEGESLLNDASALLVYRVAVGLAVGDLGSGWVLAPQLLVAVFGGAALGWGLARAWFMLPPHRADMPIDVLLQFLVTFAVWILADRLGASPIITVVVYAITIARTAPARMDARRRIASYAVWEVTVFVLNMLAFILIGLQVRGVGARLDGTLPAYAGAAAAALGAAVLVRLAWAMGWNAVVRRWTPLAGSASGPGLVRPTAGGGVLIGWCGMRGIVTLATALALPDAFPHRDLAVFCAFWVTLGTLVVQGLTLRPLMRRLTLPEDGSVEAETRAARAGTARAALAVLDESEASGEPSEAGRILRLEYAARAGGDVPAEGAIAALQGRAVAAQRRALLAMRRSGAIGDDAFHAIEEELDIIALTADPAIRALRPAEA